MELSRKDLVCGGVGEPEKPDDEIIGLAYRYREEVQKKFGTLSVFQVVSFTSQVVAGTLYEITLDIGNNRRPVLVVLRDIMGLHSLHGIN